MKDWLETLREKEPANAAQKKPSKMLFDVTGAGVVKSMGAEFGVKDAWLVGKGRAQQKTWRRVLSLGSDTAGLYVHPQPHPNHLTTPCHDCSVPLLMAPAPRRPCVA